MVNCIKSRHWNELTAWTLNFQQPLVNVFLTGDNETGAITGRVFGENVRTLPKEVANRDRQTDRLMVRGWRTPVDDGPGRFVI